MKKISVIIAIAFFNLIPGCDSPTESFVGALQYYPLKIGNKWYYSNSQTDTSAYNYVTEIVSDTTISNKLYYKIVSNYVPQSEYYYISYCHIEKSKLFIGNISFYNDKLTFMENLKADFSLKVGDTLRTDEYKYITVTEKKEDIIKFHTKDGMIHYYSTFRKGVGLIESLTIGDVFHRSVLIKYELK